ncbi:hypothetical protein M0813_14822 [Anaeramoeba flamelloides]|uniref:Uncharacterized protein n=1 Tax=Anaeramoeba flamelloides TaxID=1746091 RepID=A0ABQ8Z4N0_9EUKA|nr:hypothetical protein M0813_14822 [Anaeramoeba flamelloides]
MDLHSNKIGLLDSEKTILEKLKQTHSIKSRLILWLQLYPHSIIGLTIEHLNTNIGVSQKKNTLNNTKITKDPDPEPTQSPPKEIKLLRKSLDKLSEYTCVSRRSLERGLSSFFSRQYSLINTDPYSREWLIFGRSGGINNIQNQKNLNCQMKKLKHRKKPKVKHLRFPASNSKNLQNSQQNAKTEESQINNNNLKIKSNLNFSNLDHFQFPQFVESANLKQQCLNYHPQTQNPFQKKKQTQKHIEQILPEKITEKPSNEMLLIEFQNQNKISPLERKTPLEILCEVSQLYKKRQILSRNPLKPNHNLLTKTASINSQNNNNSCFVSHDWRSKN